MEDEPYGKFVEYDLQGKEWKKEGVYYREGDLIKEEKFESFEHNYPTDIINEMWVDNNNQKGDMVPVPHQLEGRSHINNVSAISGISNLTNQEAELEAEKKKIMG